MKTVFVFLFTALVAAAHGLERYVYFFLYFSNCNLLNTVSEHLLNDKNVGGFDFITTAWGQPQCT